MMAASGFSTTFKSKFITYIWSPSASLEDHEYKVQQIMHEEREQHFKKEHASKEIIKEISKKLKVT